MADSWQLFLFLAGLVAAWSVVIVAVTRAMLARCLGDLDKRLDSLGRIQTGAQADYRKVEQALMELRAELPVQYVRREDHIRTEVVMYAKMDRMNEKLDELQKTVLKRIPG